MGNLEPRLILLKKILVVLHSFMDRTDIWFTNLFASISFHFKFTDQLQSTATGYYILYISLAFYAGRFLNFMVFSRWFDSFGKLKSFFLANSLKIACYLVLSFYDNYYYILVGCLFQGFIYAPVGPVIYNLWVRNDEEKK